MTKHLNDDILKSPLGLEDIKVEIAPKIINNATVIGTSNVSRKPRGKAKTKIAKARIIPKRSRLEKATSQLYDLEDSCGPEKTLNIDFGLYQMETY